MPEYKRDPILPFAAPCDVPGRGGGGGVANHSFGKEEMEKSPRPTDARDSQTFMSYCRQFIR